MGDEGQAKPAHGLYKNPGRFGVLIMVVLVVAGGVTLANVIFRRSDTAPPGLTAAQQQVNFPLYYARNAQSNGFRYIQDSLSVTSDVVVLAYAYNGNKTLAVTIQPLAGGFDTGQFNPDSDFLTTIGHAYLVSLDTRTTAAIVAGKSLVLINASQTIPASNMTTFINSLRPVSRSEPSA